MNCLVLKAEAVFLSWLCAELCLSCLSRSSEADSELHNQPVEL